MGSRDYRRREPKKPKKGAAKSADTTVIPLPAPVEVIKTKGKKKEDEGED